MDWWFFREATDAEAREYLERFLEIEAAEVEAMAGEADYSLASIEPVLGRIAERVEVEDVAPPDGAPDWVVDAIRDHRGGFRVVAESSRPLVLRAAFYLGQSFVASRDGLRWDIGRRDRAEVRQPVVAGFPTGDDLPALAVAEALLLGREPAEALAGWT